MAGHFGLGFLLNFVVSIVSVDSSARSFLATITWRDSSHSVEQVFTKCVFAKTWTDDGDEKYGIHYCQVIDPAIACGYNENLKCIHDKHFFKDGQCHFLFEMQDEK